MYLKNNQIELDGTNLTIEKVISICRNNQKVLFPSITYRKINDNWNMIAKLLAKGEIMYGLNTGIGGFGNVVISPEKAGELSTRMLRAHASGYGNPVEQEIAKATLLLRLNVFAKGYSGVRSVLFQTMLDMLNKNVIPVFYNKGSVGTSGDLAPLSQMGLVIIGEGKAYWQGKIIPGKKALKLASLKSVPLAYREVWQS